MRTRFNKAVVDAPAIEYGNVAVDLEADDDVTMEATVNNRQGITLARFVGPFHPLDGTAGGYVIDTAEGPVSIQPQAGCGCGGSTVTARPAEVQA